jgi:hypothetical protein
MSFLNNLFKGFIRSSVNQVGRDGGRVISNQLYGDSYSSPVRVTQSQSVTQTITQQVESQNTDNTSYNFLSMAFADNLILRIVAYLLLCTLPFLGSLYTLLRGIEYTKKKQMEVYGTETIGIGKADRRFNSGVRVTHYKKRTVITGYAPADYAHLKYYKTKGTIYKVIGWIYLITQIIIAIIMIVD